MLPAGTSKASARAALAVTANTRSESPAQALSTAPLISVSWLVKLLLTSSTAVVAGSSVAM